MEWLLHIFLSKIGKVYSLEHTEIPEVLFMPHRWVMMAEVINVAVVSKVLVITMCWKLPQAYGWASTAFFAYAKA
jgi:hypothetical protein